MSEKKGIENFRLNKQHDSFLGYIGEPVEDVPTKRHPLDSEKHELLWRKLMAMYEQEKDRQYSNRYEQGVDADFYDSIQWSEEDAAVLRERGQQPLVYNVISSAVNWVLGTEKRGRSDYKILPRRKDAAKPAERKTQLMKYLSDVNRTSFHRSRAFEDCVKVGVGWLESGVQDANDGEPVYARYESWRNMLWDSASTDKDLSDARYIMRVKTVDIDIAQGMFKDRAGILNAASSDSLHFGIDTLGDEQMDSQEDDINGSTMAHSNITGFARRRVRLIECWHREVKEVQRLKGGDFSGEIYDPNNPSQAHEKEISEGRAVPHTRLSLRMHVSIFCSAGLLWTSESPYKHDRFPFTPIWCYRRDRNNMPYGMIRGMRGLQEDINKRASKALHILNTNKVIVEEGAVDDLDELLEEVHRPDGVIVKKRGKELQLNVDRDLAPAHMQLMSQSINMIQTLSGVTDENLGRSTNATSGKAITARQEQGSMTTAGIFDNLRFAVQVHGEKELSMIEQFFTEQKQFRITNMRGSPEYPIINDGLPENDIVHTKADFVISEADWRNSVRQAQTEELFALLQQLAPVAPQIALVTLDLLVEGMDITLRDEIVKRIREQTGMKDPDAEELTPEEQQAEQAKAQQAQQQAELQMRDAVATIATKEAKAKRDEAAAARDQANAQKTMTDERHVLAQITNLNADSQIKVLQAAITALQSPAAARTADAMLSENGYLSRTELDATAQVEEEERQAAEQQAQQQAMQQQQAEQQQQQMQQQMQQQAEQQQAMPQDEQPNMEQPQ